MGPPKFEQLFDSETISAGESKTTEPVKVPGIDFIAYHIESEDGNATDIDIFTESKTSERSVYATYDDSIANNDLTEYTNDSKIYTFDVRGVNYVRFKHIDNRGSGDDLSLNSYVGKENE